MEKQTLCWKCKNACGKCPWSDGTFTPVDGWNATQTTVRNPKSNITSYEIHDCPLYEADTPLYTNFCRNVSAKELAKLLNLDNRNFFRYADDYLKTIYHSRYGGYLIISKPNSKRKFYIGDVEWLDE